MQWKWTTYNPAVRELFGALAENRIHVSLFNSFYKQLREIRELPETEGA